MYVLARRHNVSAGDLVGALERVAAYRQVQLMPLAKVLEGFGEQAQQRWAIWRRKQRLEDRLPLAFEEVVGQVAAFADIALSRGIDNHVWSAPGLAWETDL